MKAAVPEADPEGLMLEVPDVDAELEGETDALQEANGEADGDAV